MPNVDLFLPSAEELTFMLERHTFDKLLSQAGNNELLCQINGELLSRLAQKSIEAGAGVVLIKCGHLGAYIRTAGKERLEKAGIAKPKNLDNWAEREIFEPSFKVNNVVAATGSGDSAIAGFLAAYLRDRTLEESIRYACAVGAHNVQVPDAVSGIKSWQETSRQIQANWEKNTIEISLDGWVFDSSASRYIGPYDKNR